MVAIGLCPFSRKRVIGFVAFAFLVLSVVGCFANPILLSVKTTPYDRQMARIQPILVSTPAQGANRELPLRLINRWISELRNVPYGFCMEWKTPAEVAGEPVADCKGKAVALYQQMARHGARGLRLVIGRRAPTYILDPTINWTARTVDEVADNSYVRYYAYAGHQKYRAPAASALYARL